MPVRYRRMLVGLAITLAVICGAAYLFRDAMFRALIQPGQAAPSVSQSMATSWLLRPATPPPGAWERPWGVDVFFVHDTTAIWPEGSWNGDVDEANEDKSVRRALNLYAGALETAGPVYAPAYRQAVLQAMIEVSPDSRSALDLAYKDVLAAFDDYIANDNKQRAIMLVGVGQGGLHVARLLGERFSDDLLRQRLGGAYLVETAIPETALPLPVCVSGDDTGCAIAWSTATQRQLADRPTWTGRDYAAVADTTPICVNPISWRRDNDLATAADHSGGVARFDADEAPVVLSQMVSAQCVNGLLKLVDVKTSALRPSSIWGWGKQVSPADYNLFFRDLAANIAERARAISARLDESGPKPAKPLPPVRMLDDAPIHREDGERTPVR